MTMVAGQVIAENGNVLAVDEDAIKAEVRASMPAVQRELAATATAAERLEPYYPEMYRRAAATDVGFSRWL